MRITLPRPSLRWWLLLVLLLTAAPFVGSGCVKQWLFLRLPAPLLASVAAPEGVGSLSAAACGACHTDIYAEWSGTMMGKAFTDKVFQADYDAGHQLYACLYCHAPLVEQRAEIVTHLSSLTPIRGAGMANPTFDVSLQQEGVTCVACHLREGALVGPIPGVQAPHPVVVDPDFASADRCVGCHQVAEPPLSKLDRDISDTHVEWEQWKAATGRTESCVECHMPAVERPIAAGGPVRAGRSHTWRGGWDEAMVRSGIEIAVLPDASVVLTNRTGHRFPTSDPARALGVTVAYSRRGAEIGRETRWIERSVKLPRLVDLGDTTLLPAETRTLRFDRAPSAEEADSARITVVYDRLKGLPETRPHAEVPPELVLLDETIPLASVGKIERR